MRTQLFSPDTHQESEDILGHFETKERLIIRYQQHNDMLVAMGRSVSLDVQLAYRKLFYQIKKHFLQSEQLRCYFYYTVINATTTKLLFNLFRLLNSEAKKGNQVSVYWMVKEGDEELMEIGGDFKEIFSLDFRINIK